MSISTESRSRRALLGAGVGALAASVASALGRPAPARAVDGDYVRVGLSQVGTQTTRLRHPSPNSNQIVFFAQNDGTGVALYGQSRSGYGVHGYTGATDRAGVLGRTAYNATGVLGYSYDGQTDPVTSPEPKLMTGVYGQATQDSRARGVWGHSTAGKGVHGEATSGIGVLGTATTGIGLVASTTTGLAMQTSGRVRLNRISGVAAIPAGATSAAVSPAARMTDDSFVLLTPMANIGGRSLWFVPDTQNGGFKIRISSSRASVTRVAWLMIESRPERGL